MFPATGVAADSAESLVDPVVAGLFRLLAFAPRAVPLGMLEVLGTAAAAVVPAGRRPRVALGTPDLCAFSATAGALLGPAGLSSSSSLICRVNLPRALRRTLLSPFDGALSSEVGTSGETARSWPKESIGSSSSSTSAMGVRARLRLEPARVAVAGGSSGVGVGVLVRVLRSERVAVPGSSGAGEGVVLRVRRVVLG